jgi:hypothetical protein
MTNLEYFSTLKGKKLRENLIRQKVLPQEMLNDKGEVIGEFKMFDYILPNKRVHKRYDEALDEYVKWLEEEREG